MIHVKAIMLQPLDHTAYCQLVTMYADVTTAGCINSYLFLGLIDCLLHDIAKRTHYNTLYCNPETGATQLRVRGTIT
jgi:hypothetical protein